MPLVEYMDQFGCTEEELRERLGLEDGEDEDDEDREELDLDQSTCPWASGATRPGSIAGKSALY